MANEPPDVGEASQRGARSTASSASNAPLAYLITFTTRGTWLHGDQRGSVDPEHCTPGAPFLPPDPAREALDRRRGKGSQVVLDSAQRQAVLRAIMEVARHRDWSVHALNVRTNHVHVVVSAPERPERVMNAFKAWATRRMIEEECLAAGTKPWTRHGSTRYLWKESSVLQACAYVCDSQGPDLNHA